MTIFLNRWIAFLFLTIFSSFSLIAAGDSEELTEEEQYYAWASEVWESFDRQTGEIKISSAGAILNVPDSFYFLGPKDAQTVLVDVWGNPPSDTTLGMLFPAEVTPFDDTSWGVTVEYEEDGYVSDDDANDIDYGDLLDQMKSDTRAASEERVKAGYGAIELLGWAAQPYYDTEAKKLHWAKEYKFGTSANNTLNYNIRVLGRKGVLVLNFIASMDQKAEIESNVSTVLALAEFDQGSQYSDFDPDIDQVAAYGLGALVAGKVALKTGFAAAAIIFLKKFGIYILIGLGVLFKGLFSGKKKKQ